MRTPTALLLASALSASALVIPKDSGTWPDSWPDKLEALRERSRTTEWATGSQEDTHRIPFDDRAEFEKLWPTFTELLKQGSHLNLRRPEKEASSVRDWTAPCVVVHCSPNGVGAIGGKEGDEKITVGPPWPESALLEDGSLPEYVMLAEADGETTWVPVTERGEVRGFRGEVRGFQFRARLDITLICDGETIDPDRLKVPGGVVVNDQRTK